MHETWLDYEIETGKSLKGTRTGLQKSNESTEWKTKWSKSTAEWLQFFTHFNKFKQKFTEYVGLETVTNVFDALELTDRIFFKFFFNFFSFFFSIWLKYAHIYLANKNLLSNLCGKKWFRSRKNFKVTDVKRLKTTKVGYFGTFFDFEFTVFHKVKN